MNEGPGNEQNGMESTGERSTTCVLKGIVERDAAACHLNKWNPRLVCRGDDVTRRASFLCILTAIEQVQAAGGSLNR